MLNFNVDSVTLGISLESSMKCVQCVHQREISMYHDFNIIPDLLLKVEMTLELNKCVMKTENKHTTNVISFLLGENTFSTV